VLDQPRFWLPTVSATFHGRDLFGPVAAHLARGVQTSELGSPLDTIQRIRLTNTGRDLDADGHVLAVHGEVIHVDRFGNLITGLRSADLPAAPIVEIAGRSIDGLVPHFQPGTDAVIALIGSVGLLEIAVPNGSAATLIGAAVTVTTRPRAEGRRAHPQMSESSDAHR
jgi:S-adenosylmethionine hydrolase